MSWTAVDEGWGRRAPEWAYLLEKQYWGAYVEVFDRLGVGPGVRHLDVACGSGLAGHIAARRGAEVAGLDAAARLLGIARARTPGADWRAGDMYALPWEDAAFDVVTSFNGIWGPDQALAASGPAYAGVVASGEEPVREAFREMAAQLVVPGAGVRADLNWGYLVGRRPT